jgi:uroporphyrinogen III methyltransferase / synthase
MDKPLEGKRIVVTRAPEQAQDLIHSLEALGAEVLLFPTVQFVPPEDWRELDEQLSKLYFFQAILFLSKNAVHYFFRRFRDLGIKCYADGSSDRLIAAVGPGTAREAEANGFHVDIVASEHTGHGLARELGDSIKGRNVLIPRGDLADDAVPDELRAAGARVTQVVVYRSVAPEKTDPAIAAQILHGDADAVIFASPSAFHHFSKILGDADLLRLSARTHFAAIGPTTARALRDAGIRVEIEAAEASSVGLADALVKYFQRSSVAGRPS